MVLLLKWCIFDMWISGSHHKIHHKLAEILTIWGFSWRSWLCMLVLQQYHVDVFNRSELYIAYNLSTIYLSMIFFNIEKLFPKSISEKTNIFTVAMSCVITEGAIWSIMLNFLKTEDFEDKFYLNICSSHLHQ